MSRSLFAWRFAELVGQPPLAYVTDWRMRLARVWLRDETATVAEVAARAGYGSTASFGRAFRHTFGEAPGTLRQRDRSLV
ncbi:MAG: helix-turn-helix transcriptional regulator [Sandaracinaceae bacterium]|nr:helix-turn-helix transcriptional regulator [Myxococcales bacterium]MCB9662297.1 helix-turn-helix transcriptional regulator [Sandaracinaceae bacterium]